MSRASKGNSRPRAARIEIRGKVQGVGFRPYIYRCALSNSLHGWVANSARGALLEIEGKPASIAAFLRQVRSELPSNARITSFITQPVPSRGFTRFEIVKSIGAGSVTADLPPDLTVCDDCRDELFTPGDRRYRYPFINCTGCGPRFSIVKTLPYDRRTTTMAKFRLCPACGDEYRNPADRRFHAQPDACPVCGPQVRLLDRNFSEQHSGDAAVRKAEKLLSRGAVVAVKGMGGYHLACDAFNAAAVKRLRARKRRPAKPFALMVPDIPAARALAEVSAEEEALLLSPQRPIVLLKKHSPVLGDMIAPRNACIGVMLPGTPLHYLLFTAYFAAAQSVKPSCALVMTSGNRRDEPICRDEESARAALSGIADYFLVHDRPIHNRCDDSILAALKDRAPVFIRRSRGFVPEPVVLKPADPAPVFAAGAEMKNTFCLTRGDHAYVSPYIGDLDGAETQEFYRESLERFTEYLNVKPELIAHDLHPDYHSTRFARATAGSRIPLVAVQHHHAHAASVLAEQGMRGPAVGFVFDGTGFGTDGTIWGGECFYLRGPECRRIAHLEPFHLPGGEKAILEPWRIALALLRRAGIETVPGHLKHFPVRAIRTMIDRNLNAPLCSSMGRLFDGIAALVGIRTAVSFEAQAAMELEAAAVDNRSKKGYNFSLKSDGNSLVAGIGPLVREVIADCSAGVPVSDISARFHTGLARLVEQLAVRFSAVHRTRNIILSGGCFQNRLLLGQCIERLEGRGLKPLYNRIVPTNDGGISLGQAWIARQLAATPAKRSRR